MDIFLIQIPFVRTQYIAWWAQGISLLLEGGIPLATALALTEKSIPNQQFCASIHNLKTKIDEGYSLAHAMINESHLFSTQICAILSVGYEAEKLPAAFAHIADQQTTIIKQKLHRISTIIPPILMIFLGILLILLIMIIYSPLMTFANTI